MRVSLGQSQPPEIPPEPGNKPKPTLILLGCNVADVLSRSFFSPLQVEVKGPPEHLYDNACAALPTRSATTAPKGHHNIDLLSSVPVHTALPAVT